MWSELNSAPYLQHMWWSLASCSVLENKTMNYLQLFPWVASKKDRKLVEDMLWAGWERHFEWGESIIITLDLALIEMRFFLVLKMPKALFMIQVLKKKIYVACQRLHQKKRKIEGPYQQSKNKGGLFCRFVCSLIFVCTQVHSAHSKRMSQWHNAKERSRSKWPFDSREI